MEHLAERGVACPLPVQAGTARRCAAGRKAGGDRQFLDGLWPRRTPQHCAAVGDALARCMSPAGIRDQRPNALSVEGWRPLFDGRARRIVGGLAREIEGSSTTSRRAGRSDLPAGVIHADLFPDNVFFLDGRLSGVIDFYFACNDFLAYDVAICLNAWCFEPDGLQRHQGAGAAAAYDMRPLTDDESAALPVLARGTALRFLLTRLYDWLNRRPARWWGPRTRCEYLNKLRFHRGVRAGGYGL